MPPEPCSGPAPRSTSVPARTSTSHEANDIYLLLLMATMAARDPAFDQLVTMAEALDPERHQPGGAAAAPVDRPPPRLLLAAERRDQQRWAWRRFFADHDVVLAPITATPPFLHDHSEPMQARTMTVNGAEVPYFGQLFWAGLAISTYLPATAVPVGRTDDGLPVGMQIIGDAYRDRTTIWAAGELAKLIGGYSPPPGW